MNTEKDDEKIGCLIYDLQRAGLGEAELNALATDTA